MVAFGSISSISLGFYTSLLIVVEKKISLEIRRWGLCYATLSSMLFGTCRIILSTYHTFFFFFAGGGVRPVCRLRSLSLTLLLTGVTQIRDDMVAGSLPTTVRALLYLSRADCRPFFTPS